MIRPPKTLFIYQFEGKSQKLSRYTHPLLMGIWQEEGEVFLFFTEPLDGEIDKIKKEFSELSFKQRFEVGYDEWHGGELKPVEVCGLTIAPFWYRNHISNNSVLIDPGVVFGTPNHATTLNCIRAIKEIFMEDKVSLVLDMGCGTGILGIVALKLGASQVISFDTNHLACTTAKKNFTINGYKRNFLLFQARAEEFYHIKAELVLANLPFFVIKSFFNKEEFWSSKRWVVISGVFPSQAGYLLEALSHFPLKDFVSHELTIGDKWPVLMFKVRKR